MTHHVAAGSVANGFAITVSAKQSESKLFFQANQWITEHITCTHFGGS